MTPGCYEALISLFGGRREDAQDGFHYLSLMTGMHRPSPSSELNALFGGIDVYLFDQLQKGRFDHRTSILDAGCGGGRNLIYFLQRGFQVHGLDQSPRAIDQVKALASALAPSLSPDNFRIGAVDVLPWPDAAMDVVLSNAVLHFADDEAHFERMLTEMWRVLTPGGLFFARLTSEIGIENKVRWLEGRRAQLPDGSERFLVNESMLLDWGRSLGGELVDPIKTTNVQGMRCMTTWVLEKNAHDKG